MLGGFMGNRSAKKSASKQNKYDRRLAHDQFVYDTKRARQQQAINIATEQRQQDYIENTEKERFSWLVKGAENAGFNPLTVLGATGGGMGQSPNALAETAAGQTAARRMAPLSNIGNSIAAAGEQFARFMPDPISIQTQKLNNQLLEKQIAQIDRENLRFGQPRLQTTSSPVTDLSEVNAITPRPMEATNARRILSDGTTSVKVRDIDDVSELPISLWNDMLLGYARNTQNKPAVARTTKERLEQIGGRFSHPTLQRY